jgi:hypothetical protein
MREVSGTGAEPRFTIADLILTVSPLLGEAGVRVTVWTMLPNRPTRAVPLLGDADCVGVSPQPMAAKRTKNAVARVARMEVS